MSAAVKENFQLLVLVIVLLILLVFMFLFKADHDVLNAVDNWVAGVLGGILGLVTGKIHAASQSNVNSKVTQVVEGDNK